MQNWQRITDKFRVLSIWVGGLLELIALIFTVLTFLPEPTFYIDNASQLRVLYLAFFLLATCCSTLLRNRPLLIGALIGFLLNLSSFTQFVPTIIRAPATDYKLKIVAANVAGYYNPNCERFLEFIRHENPDIISVEEFTPKWLATLQASLPEYTFQFDEGLSGGTAIFSRVPFEPIVLMEGERKRRYSVRGTILLGGKKTLFIASHTASPYSQRKWQLRNIEFERLAYDAKNSEMPVIIAGDLNSTRCSWYFRRLLKSSGLVDSENGFLPQPSWSTRMPICLLPIDHCLCSATLVVLNRRTGPHIGSDHLPLIIEIALAK